MKTRPLISRCVAGAMLLCITGIAACSKDENKNQQASVTAVPAPQPSSFAKTVLTYIPEQSVGFLLWEGKHPAYEKLSNSPWGGTQSDWTKALQDSSKEWTQVREILAKAGLNPDDKKTWKGVLSEAAMFAAPSSEAGKPGAIGVVLRPDPSVKLADKLNAAKGELGKMGNVEIQDVKVDGGTAFSIRGKEDSSDEEKIFVGWNQNVAVFASSDWAVANVLASKGDKIPALVSSPNFERAARGLPADSARFATGFVDIQKMIEVSDRLGAAGGESMAKLKSGDIPLKGLSFAMGMTDTPETNIRLVYDPADKQKNSWLGALNASSSTEILTALPAKPLLFLSLDGQTLRQIRDMAVTSMGAAGAQVKTELALLDHVKRLGIAARSAAPGQSMLPIPEIMIVAESDQPASTAKDLQGIVTVATSGSGLPGMQWTDKKIGETPVKSMMTPFNVGVFLASNKNLVLLTSTEGQMKSALDASKPATFASALPTRVGEVFVKQDSLGNIYVNFVEVAALMESMSGMLSMYAPEGSQNGQYLQTENIEAMKKMGTVVGSVKLEEGVIGIDSFYEQSKPAA